MKDKRYDSSVNVICSQNGFITKIEFKRPISSNGKIWEQDIYSWSTKTKAYHKENSIIERNFLKEESNLGSDKCIYSEKLNISMKQAHTELKKSLLDMSSHFHVDIKISNHKVNYDEFCKNLDKSEAIFEAHTLLNKGVSNSQFAQHQHVKTKLSSTRKIFLE
ncbi:hypothetical protein [Mucilaginibacter paludis]|uniref:Uncharacterized protein n=1 Tax=Mucilaginibacter paludis DSM 18603 TaxID=714943 RepID=H1Y3K6_9SPHI|nr:hypothetical protein [Mucilaginibacter paludis]EHQ29774.1 hypothetical protein Mucpa_5705 [Mucilaginibacter paludis DSM 18603]